METDDPNYGDYVVYGHVVCGRVCYDARKREIFPPWMERLLLPLHLDTG